MSMLLVQVQVLSFSVRSPFLPILNSCRISPARKGPSANFIIYFVLARRTFLPGLEAVCGVLPAASLLRRPPASEKMLCILRKTAPGEKEHSAQTRQKTGLQVAKDTNRLLPGPSCHSSLGQNKLSFELFGPPASNSSGC